jgi:cyanate lyase
MTRNDVTELIVFNRMKKGITWASLAEACGKSLPWTTSALLGQHQMSKVGGCTTCESGLKSPNPTTATLRPPYALSPSLLYPPPIA